MAISRQAYMYIHVHVHVPSPSSTICKLPIFNLLSSPSSGGKSFSPSMPPSCSDWPWGAAVQGAGGNFRISPWPTALESRVNPSRWCMRRIHSSLSAVTGSHVSSPSQSSPGSIDSCAIQIKKERLTKFTTQRKYFNGVCKCITWI